MSHRPQCDSVQCLITPRPRPGSDDKYLTSSSPQAILVHTSWPQSTHSMQFTSAPAKCLQKSIRLTTDTCLVSSISAISRPELRSSWLVTVWSCEPCDRVTGSLSLGQEALLTPSSGGSEVAIKAMRSEELDRLQRQVFVRIDEYYVMICPPIIANHPSKADSYFGSQKQHFPALIVIMIPFVS